MLEGKQLRIEALSYNMKNLHERHEVELRVVTANGGGLDEGAQGSSRKRPGVIYRPP